MLGERPEHVAYGVGHDREVFAVARAEPTRYLIARVRGPEVRTMTITEQRVVSYVQPMGEDVLIASARCQWRPSGAEKNAVIVDRDGGVRSMITLGDGINGLNVARDGTIWVSYFDEGVFGNYGWSRPGPRAIGAPGLVAFDANGDTRFTYRSDAAGTDDICDAYATTLTEDGAVWVYFYTEFPIVRVGDGEYRVWKFGVSGGRALAVYDDHALLVGDYEKQSLARLVHLQRNGVAKVVREFDVTDDEGRSMESALAVGRGHDVFFFRDGRAYLLTNWWSHA